MHRHHSTNAPPSLSSDPNTRRLLSLRNIGIFAHVDAGKTTLTERMLALSGIVRKAGSVDTGDTVTDYLPAERERGITIQSAAVGFDWVVPASTNNGGGEEKKVEINLIDTPGHVDFSVEVHRSVAVLDGAVLVLDAVAGVQAQTETVWRSMRNTNINESTIMMNSSKKSAHGSHGHEPLPAIMYVNKMDRDGADLRYAMDTVRRKLVGSNPVAVQLPLYRAENSSAAAGDDGLQDIQAGVLHDSAPHGDFVGVLDFVNMRALIYPPHAEGLSMEDAVPTVVNLMNPKVFGDENNRQVIVAACDARRDLIAALADVDEVTGDTYLLAMEDEPREGNGIFGSCPILSTITTSDIQSAIRRATLDRSIMPTMCGAALRGLGVEPVLDGVAEWLPCPLDRLPPRLTFLGKDKQSQKQKDALDTEETISLGHPLNPSTVAYVFKVVHMKGRGGSGDGRVAFARVYSGTLKARDTIRVISPGFTTQTDDAKKKQKHPIERIGGMLELSGGRFDNLLDGMCHSGDVCALVGLKSVVTGDTLLLPSAAETDESKKKAKGKKDSKNNTDSHWKQYLDGVHLAGLMSPDPVLTLRIEASSSSEQAKLSTALNLLSVEDPSLVVEETPTVTHISGLGELHMEICLDRLRREFGLEVRVGKPAVAYRESVVIEDDGGVETGLVEYDRTVGGVRLHGAVRLRMTPSVCPDSKQPSNLQCLPPQEPIVKISPATRAYFNLDPNADASQESELKYPPALRALLSGARGSLKRGRLGPYPLANLTCHILEVDSELSSAETLPGAMRAAAANAVTTLLESLAKDDRMVILEPKMNVEISVPTGRVGDVLSDLTVRRGTVDDVAMGDEGGGGHIKSMVRAEVPLVEILGYADSLRSLTGGEGAFSAEYKGHAPREGV
jgi:elongation factor G